MKTLILIIVLQVQKKKKMKKGYYVDERFRCKKHMPICYNYKRGYQWGTCTTNSQLQNTFKNQLCAYNYNEGLDLNYIQEFKCPRDKPILEVINI